MYGVSSKVNYLCITYRRNLKDNIKFFRNREEFMYGMIIRLENGMRGLVAEEVRK